MSLRTNVFCLTLSVLLGASIAPAHAAQTASVCATDKSDLCDTYNKLMKSRQQYQARIDKLAKADAQANAPDKLRVAKR